MKYTKTKYIMSTQTRRSPRLAKNAKEDEQRRQQRQQLQQQTEEINKKSIVGEADGATWRKT